MELLYPLPFFAVSIKLPLFYFTTDVCQFLLLLYLACGLLVEWTEL